MDKTKGRVESGEGGGDAWSEGEWWGNMQATVLEQQ